MRLLKRRLNRLTEARAAFVERISKKANFSFSLISVRLAETDRGGAMTTTNSFAHIAERILMGFLGASITSVSPFVNWFESNFQWTSTGVQVTQAGVAIALVLCWAAALYIAAREPEPHLYGSLFKAAGLPGVLSGLAHILQVTVK
jgi:hypothetical protein